MKDFKVEIIKHTGIEELRAAINSTMAADFAAKCSLKQAYSWMHSPIRTQVFSIQLTNIPTFVSVHLVRHVMAVPFVKSNRDDRGGNKTEDRYTPVTHRIFCNAEAIMAMAHKRLCFKASPETREVMLAIKKEMQAVDPALAYHMVPNCVYRGGICPEPKSCGNYCVRRFRGTEDEINMNLSRLVPPSLIPFPEV